MTAYFDRTFGPDYLDSLRPGIGDLGDIGALLRVPDMLVRDEYVPDVDMFEKLLAGAPIGAGRRVNVADHIDRAMPIAIDNLTPALAAKVERMIGDMNGQLWRGSGNRLGGGESNGNESDEDSQRDRRRRRCKQETPSSAGGSCPVKVESDVTDADKIGSAQPEETEEGDWVIVKADTEKDETKPSVAKPIRAPVYGLPAKSESNDRKPIRRFGLDKNHLQALSQVDQD